MIQIKNLSKIFQNGDKKFVALDDINLDIEKGDIFGVIGFSGAGKSTLVRCINRLEEASGGDIYINGKNIITMDKHELRENRKKIGMIFQHFNLLSSRTVAENIAYPMEISNIDKKVQEKRIDELLDLVELKDKKGAYPAQLSGGQKQRVGIARALANNPDVLLCDEATSALDPKTTKSILNLIKDINKKLGLTIVIITHEMEAIKQICTKVAVMENGKIIENGMAKDIFSRPKNDITKGFVQSIVHDIPDEFHSDSDKKELLRLSFIGTKTKEPVLSNMIKTHNVDASILLGGIDRLDESIIGNLVIELSGEKVEIQKAIKYLNDNNVNCEVINNE